MGGCQDSRGEHSTAAEKPGGAAIPYNPTMAEDKGKEEEQFELTPELEGYFNLADAILSARQLVRQDEQRYLNRTGWEEIVWSTSESEAGDASLKVILQFRRPDRGISEEANGLEEFLFGYNGVLQDRQVLFWPNNSSAPTVTEPVPTPLLTPTPKPIPTSSLTTVPTPSTVYVSQWGTLGSGDGQFTFPIDIAVASDGRVYVADLVNSRIQEFTSDGGYLSQWGMYGSGDGHLAGPMGVAVASDGSVYVADSNNNRIQKFTSNGVFVTKWGNLGSGDGQFKVAFGVAVASDGSVYVADYDNNRIQKFTSEGAFVTKWGAEGTDNWPFAPSDVAEASDGSIYVADRNNHRILTFTSEGVFVSQWNPPGQGIGDGQFHYPKGIAVASDGSVYVADKGNNRIQKFSVGE